VVGFGIAAEVLPAEAALIEAVGEIAALAGSVDVRLRLDVAYALVRAVSRLVSTPAKAPTHRGVEKVSTRHARVRAPHRGTRCNYATA
jgi:hypothetical protein